jgi:CRISPR/Cas system-associated exonuclease Cas4 (RecB family)
MATDWPKDLDHFSASSLKMAVRCPEQWRQRYVKGRKYPPSLSMLGGRANHSAIEASMTQKIESHVDLPTPDVKGLFVQHLEEAVDESGGLGELEEKAGVKPSVTEYDDLRRDGQGLVGLYHTQVSPVVQPVAVEKKFELQPPTLPVQVIGYIDLVADVGGEKIMIDRKTGTRSRKKPEPEWVIQAEVYQLAEPIPHAWHVSVTTKTPQLNLPSEGNELLLPVVNERRGMKMLEQVAAEIGFYYMKYGPDEGWPAKGKLHPWACNYCGYRSDCWGWK